MIEDVEGLLAAAAQDSSRAPAFFTALLRSDVVVPGVVLPVTGDIAAAGSMAQFAVLPGVDGVSVQPFYTSEGALQDTLAALPSFEPRYVQLECRAFLEMTRGSHLVLNPHSAYGKRFLPAEVDRLLLGSAALVEQVLARETEIAVGVPATVPEGMQIELTRVFSRHDGVVRARLGWKVVPATGDAAYLLVIEGAADLRDRLSDDLGRALMPFSQMDPIDVMFAQANADNLLSSIDPFFERPAKTS